MLVGGGLGYLFATLFRHWFQGHPRSFHLIVLASVEIYCDTNLTSCGGQYPPNDLEFWSSTLSASLAIGVALSVLFIPWITSTLLLLMASHQYAWKGIFGCSNIHYSFLVFPVFLQTGVQQSHLPGILCFRFVENHPWLRNGRGDVVRS